MPRKNKKVTVVMKGRGLEEAIDPSQESTPVWIDDSIVKVFGITFRVVGINNEWMYAYAEDLDKPYLQKDGGIDFNAAEGSAEVTHMNGWFNSRGEVERAIGKFAEHCARIVEVKS